MENIYFRNESDSYERNFENIEDPVDDAERAIKTIVDNENNSTLPLNP